KIADNPDAKTVPAWGHFRITAADINDPLSPIGQLPVNRIAATIKIKCTKIAGPDFALVGDESKISKPSPGLRICASGRVVNPCVRVARRCVLPGSRND